MDGCPNLTAKKVLKQMKDKETEINPEMKLLFLQCFAIFAAELKLMMLLM